MRNCLTRYITIVCISLLAALNSIGAQNIGDEFVAAGIAYRIISNNRVEVISRGDVNYKGLVSIGVPKTVTYNGRTFNIYSLGARAFLDCTTLQRVVLPSTVTSLGSATFEGCTSLRQINIPSGVTHIGDYAFQGCRNLEEIKLPPSVRDIGYRAFAGCTALKEIDIDAVTLDFYCFDGCTALKTVDLGERLRAIGKCAFRNCTALTDIAIPYEVREIDDSTFYNCAALSRVYIGESVDTIMPTAFLACHALESFTVSPYNEYYTDINGALCDIERQVLYIYPEAKCEPEMNFTLSTVRRIAKWAFRGNQRLRRFVIKSSINDVDEEAFIGCSNLEYFELPLSTQTIGNRALAGCPELTYFRVRTTIRKIGDDILVDSRKLEQFHCRQRHPDVVEIAPNAFRGIPASCPLYVPLGYGDAYAAVDGWKYFSSIIEEDVFVPGDVNDDELCNVSDISAVYAYILDPDDPNNLIDPEAADVNHDGEVNVSDISAIYEIIITDE